MSPELLTAIAQLAWPLMAGAVIWRLFPFIRDVAKSRAFSVKVGDMEISVQEASNQLQAQIDDVRAKLSELKDSLKPPDVVSESVSSATTQAYVGTRVLWVDDVPTNNAYAMAQLRARGLEVFQALSTAEALQCLAVSRPPIAVVISDMGREEEGQFRGEAGLALLKAMRERSFRQPFMVCTTASAAPRYDVLVREAGGNGATSSFTELFDFLRLTTGMPHS